MEALVWLAIPFVTTGIAAAVLRWRSRRAQDAAADDRARRRRLARIERALTTDAGVGTQPAAGAGPDS